MAVIEREVNTSRQRKKISEPTRSAESVVTDLLLSPSQCIAAELDVAVRFTDCQIEGARLECEMQVNMCRRDCFASAFSRGSALW